MDRVYHHISWTATGPSTWGLLRLLLLMLVFLYKCKNLLRIWTLILSVFTYAIEVLGCTFYSKYLTRIDELFARCYKLSYCLKQHSILDILRNRDMKLWRRISFTNKALSDLLPPQRTRQMRNRSHNYILPSVRTSRFKSVFINIWSLPLPDLSRKIEGPLLAG